LVRDFIIPFNARQYVNLYFQDIGDEKKRSLGSSYNAEGFANGLEEEEGEYDTKIAPGEIEWNEFLRLLEIAAGYLNKKTFDYQPSGKKKDLHYLPPRYEFRAREDYGVV
jgi:hypothetical protein